MVSIRSGYVIVNPGDDILLSTLSSNRRAAWESFMERLNYRRVYADRQEAIKRGFKCVRVEITTERYQR